MKYSHLKAVLNNNHIQRTSEKLSRFNSMLTHQTACMNLSQALSKCLCIFPILCGF